MYADAVEQDLFIQAKHVNIHTPKFQAKSSFVCMNSQAQNAKRKKKNKYKTFVFEHDEVNATRFIALSLNCVFYVNSTNKSTIHMCVCVQNMHVCLGQTNTYFKCLFVCISLLLSIIHWRALFSIGLLSMYACEWMCVYTYIFLYFFFSLLFFLTKCAIYYAVLLMRIQNGWRRRRAK